MRLPLSWLADHVDLAITPEELADRLALSGTGVEAVHLRGIPRQDGNLDAFRVGRVLSVEPHPDADRLSVCQVDLGGANGPSQIVCGAPNVAPGQLVAVALPGAVMPGGHRLEVATLRGVESNGMICSEVELELGAEADGIMVLENGAAPGVPLVEMVPAAAETILELELTSNRPDCMSIAGMARETAAVLDTAFHPPDPRPPEAAGTTPIEQLVGLRVEDPDLCLRYTARAFEDVHMGPSPPWLRHRLEAAGMRSISNVVDITNYVMLLTGQPLHAFDLDRLAGPEIVVRRAAAGERLVTLDDVERRLDPSMLAICDADGPVAVAGVMGAEAPEVSDGTTRVLLEAATFDGPSVLSTSLALGLRTESSGRFEKGLPVELAAMGSAIAARMLVELCGARMAPGVLDLGRAGEIVPPVELRHARVELLLGDPVDPAESAAILRRLGCEVEEGATAHRVGVPWFRRSDLTREADLVEEVGRIRGYDRIAPRLPRTTGRGRRTPMQDLRERIARRAADLGLSQAITYSMVPEADADRLRLASEDPRRDVVRLANPLSEEMTVMRRSMLPGLLRAAARNQAHQRASGALFELGRTYAPRPDGLADEREWLAALVVGEQGGGHWRTPARPSDLFAAAGLLEALAAIARVRLDVHANEAPYFHPARQVRMQAGDAAVGWAGEVHPLVLRAFDVRGPAAAVVLDLEALLAAAPTASIQFEDLLSVPVSIRDLALIVDATVAASSLPALAREATPLVRDAFVFDRYEGDQVPEGRVSLALRLTVADPGRTLTDDEIDAQVRAVVDALRDRLGAELRA